jgi:hypothetical protein
MNPNPLSINSLAIVPVGIPESPPSDGQLNLSWKVGQSRQYALGKSIQTGYEVVLGGVAGAAAAAGFSLFGGGYVVQKCRPHFGHTQN